MNKKLVGSTYGKFKGYFFIFSNQRLIYWYFQVLIIYIYVQNIK